MTGTATFAGARLRLTRNGSILTATLHGGDGPNLLTIDSLAEIERFARDLHGDAETRVVILRGEGPHFCGGFHLEERLTELKSDASLMNRSRQADLGRRMMTALAEIPAVTIAAVQGVAAGGGACLATACDFRIAAEDARMGYPEVRRGFNLMWGALPLCVRLIGPARAKRLIMLGRLERAETLERWGFVDQVVPLDQLPATVEDMAQQYAGLPPLAAQMVKRSVNAVSGALDAALMHMESDQFLLAADSHDSREGIAAFLEGREPAFSGR
ncbi:enoyl-CoA hydratase/isomerase family protein [Lutimaribacter marinistellae]|uniref:Enoyl-CoA hydratase/isomerase family protein n=1 Tax=Lutimaribacter marinistellae TaxID=1820329 RepID=A0ABV7TBB5_9RHOB